MKKIFTLSLLSLAIGSQAQITLDQSSYASWTPRVDSFRRITSAASVAAAANMNADLSTATYDTVFTKTYVPISNAAFTAATYGLNFVDGVASSTNNGFVWRSTQVRGNTSVGIQAFGEAMTRQSYAIVALGNPADSVIFPTQNIIYSSARTLLKFPATAGTTWTNSYKYTVNLGITLSAYMMNNTPSARITYATDNMNVAGWGKMKVKTLGGTASGTMDVLAVKATTRYVDSLMLNGVAAPAMMVTGFGFTQGDTTDVYVIHYYRAGEVSPLLSVTYSDASYTTPTRAEAHTNRLAAPTGVYALNSQNNNISLYPMPVASNGVLNVELTEMANGTWAYELVDATGRVVASSNLQFTDNKAAIDLKGTAAGMNYLRLNKNGATQVVKPVSIVR